MAANGYYSYDMIHLEIELLRFYYDILLKEIQWSIGIRNSYCLQAIRNAYSKSNLQDALSSVNFADCGMRAACIFINTPCFSSTVAYHFINLLHFNRFFLPTVLSKGTLSICCLGGGPAPEVVAILKALELNLKMFYRSTKPLLIHATVIDIDQGWAQTLKIIVQNWWKIVDCRFVKLKLSFIQADLTEPLSEEVKIALRNSDLVTMVKFLSAVYGTKKRNKISEMLKGITSNISANGVLFYMNCSRFACIEDVRASISSSVDMAPIYGPFNYDEYYLSQPSKSVCFDLYYPHYEFAPPTLTCKNHVAAWQKKTKRKGTVN